MSATTLAQPLELPNGSTLPNRIGKAAMSEQLGTTTNEPTERLVTLYETWGKGGAGLLITGNVMIDRRALGEPGNVVLEEGAQHELFGRWAEAGQAAGAQVLVQINHPGRQAPKLATAAPVAPSEVPLKGFAGTFAKPRALEEAEIEELVQRFGATARLCVEAGFAGVEIHGAHGYLISQFLSPLTNLREDGWGGDAERRRRFLIEVVRSVRKQAGPKATVALKLNSADFQRGGFTEEESMDVVRALNAEGLDLLEISGGTYEQSTFELENTSESTQAREAFFIDYAVKVREVAKMPLMLTGGLRTLAGMTEALATGAVDVVGLARPLAVEPDLPARLLSGEADAAIPVEVQVGLNKKLDSFVEISWYQQQLQRMGDGKAPDPKSCRLGAVLKTLTHAFTHRPRAPQRA